MQPSSLGFSSDDGHQGATAPALLHVTLCAALLLSGCTGAIRTSTIPTDALSQPGKNVDGIVFYPPAYFFELSVTTTILDKDGKVIGKALATPPTCRPIEVRRLAVHPDYARPQLIQYQHGLLEGYKFAVELDNGMLKSVNVESSPDQGKTISNLASAAKDFGALAAFTSGPPACTDGAALVGLERYSDFPK